MKRNPWIERAAPALKLIAKKPVEHALLVVFTPNEVTQAYIMGIGSEQNVGFDLYHMKEILEQHGAGTSFLIAHNHPDGALFPSKDDVDVTHMVMDFFQSMPYLFQDHVIVAKKGYFSMKENGYVQGT